MAFQVGDPVMHWTYGFGQIVNLEERDLGGKKILYYAVKMLNLMTVWVPADSQLASRLRPPTSEAKFKRILAILTAPGESLPNDRQERKLRLQEQLKDGRIESVCQVIRDLSAYRQVKSLNEYDQAIMKRSQNILLGEWGFALSLSPLQAELELRRVLASRTEGI